MTTRTVTKLVLNDEFNAIRLKTLKNEQDLYFFVILNEIQLKKAEKSGLYTPIEGWKDLRRRKNSQIGKDLF